MSGRRRYGKAPHWVLYREIFGHKNGLTTLGSDQEDDSDGILAKVKNQAAKRRTDKMTAGLATAERSTTEEQREYTVILWTK